MSLMLKMRCKGKIWRLSDFMLELFDNKLGFARRFSLNFVQLTDKPKTNVT